jgi:long-subunit fatty acid transport protein
MKGYILKVSLMIGLIICGIDGFSQTTEISVIDSTSQKSTKWKFGMGFGLNFVGGTNINLAPNLNYKVSDKVSFGVGLQYNYSSIKDLQTTSTFGGTVATMYSPIKKITTLLEFAELHVNTKRETPVGEIESTYWDSALFVGAGFNITEKISIGAKYNVLYKEDESVYTSPIIPFVNISF